MPKKTLFAFGGILVILLIGGSVLFFSGKREALAPKSGEAERADPEDASASFSTESALPEENRSVNIDDLTASIISDLSEDEAVLGDEAGAVLNELEEEERALDALGESYDETQY